MDLETRLEKAEWLHDRYIDIFKPYGDGKVPEKDLPNVRKSMQQARVEADKKFGVMKGKEGVVNAKGVHRS